MYVNVFRSRKRTGHDAAAYAADAARMVELAKVQPGFIDTKTFAAPDGETVTLSVWENAAAAAAWGRHPEHRAAQARGREDYYDAFEMFTCDNAAVRRFAR